LNVSKEDAQLSAVIQEARAELEETYCIKVSELLEDLSLWDDGEDGSIPLEIWLGVVQAVANASGYRLILHAAIFQPVADDSNIEQIVGYREVAAADPLLFVKTASD
jgi:hypothetical protein